MDSKYILLVEDNPEDVELTTLAFKKNNFTNEIKVVEDGQEAIDFLLGDHPEGVSENDPPEWVLLDLKLSKLNGHEVLRRIKENKTHTCCHSHLFTERRYYKGVRFG